MEIENKIKKVLHRMVEEKRGEHTKQRFQSALDSVIDSQFEQGRIEEEGVARLQSYVKMLLDEHFTDEEFEELDD